MPLNKKFVLHREIDYTRDNYQFVCNSSIVEITEEDIAMAFSNIVDKYSNPLLNKRIYVDYCGLDYPSYIRKKK